MGKCSQESPSEPREDEEKASRTKQETSLEWVWENAYYHHLEVVFPGLSLAGIVPVVNRAGTIYSWLNNYTMEFYRKEKHLAAIEWKSTQLQILKREIMTWLRPRNESHGNTFLKWLYYSNMGIFYEQNNQHCNHTTLCIYRTLMTVCEVVGILSYHLPSDTSVLILIVYANKQRHAVRKVTQGVRCRDSNKTT